MIRTISNSTIFRKFYFTLFSILIFAQISICQNTDKKFAHYLGVNSFGCESGVYLGPYYSLSGSLAEFDIGVSIPLMNHNGQKPYGIGQFFDFKIYPNKHKNKLNLFFTYNMNNVMMDRGKTYEYLYGGTSRFGKTYYTEHLIGYGFDYNFLKRINFFTSVAMGMYSEWVIFDNRIMSSPKDYNFMIKFGLEYRIR
ncbi:MAG: hypothetical protein JXR36_09280 [Bacteroidales bacterium]|nr:hypothetical protein [Bacteroidales bacterium]